MMSPETPQSKPVSTHSSEANSIVRAAHVEQALKQMRAAIGDLTQYSSQELHDLISYFQEFCVTLDDEAMSKAPLEPRSQHGHLSF
jgi:hypothetical protein